MGEATQAPGFFGKLRSHGDFVSRRLPLDVRDCFDTWLQRALLRARHELGAAWLPTWGSSPLWRFLVGAGVCGGQAWTGVMMPSSDRVGRCFPLLLAVGVDGTPSLRDCLTLHESWFAQLEDLALETIDASFSLEDFDRALLARGGTPPGKALVGSACDQVPTGYRSDCTARVRALASASISTIGDTCPEQGSAWWTDGSRMVRPCLAVCPGLPSPAGFAAMLDGQWSGRGWSGGTD